MKKVLFALVATFALLTTAKEQPSPAQVKLHRHIETTMPLTVRKAPTDTLGNIALPRPFSVPCVKGGFHNMFYWDTYYTNAGLLLDGDIWQSRNNIENIAALIERFGYMPNASAESMLNRSQPPHFAQMLRDYTDATADTAFLAAMLPALEKEYNFWMTERIAPNGLNTYGHQATDDQLVHFLGAIAGRIGVDSSTLTHEQKVAKGAHMLAEAESGWDFNPRFQGRCMDFNPVDLNALLYGYETNIAHFLNLLGRPGAKEWTAKADARAKRMRSLMVDPKTKLWYDYDYVGHRRSPVLSAAAFTPLWQGIASKAEAKALVKNIGRLEADHGIMACEPSPQSVNYQWDAPNGWAPIHFYALKGLDRYGYADDAARIARKYVESMDYIYGKTGQLWEKFNARKGNTEVNAEYPMPGDFMGWTAGAYQTAYNYLFGPDRATDAPRIANIILYMRLTEPRRVEIPEIAWLTDSVMFHTVIHQLDLLEEYDLPCTFMIQYDAMVSTADESNYQQLLKERVLTNPAYELGGWYEITQPHVEDAGMTWRGKYSWDYWSNVGFSVGYTPEERIKLVDVYMEKFKDTFGYYPKVMGSWFIDPISLNYMQEKYGVMGHCYCRDQLGTDGYNLWGGYWHGGYYPSKKNMYVPAQTRDQQINIPSFRMLGSDPIDQYDNGLGGRHQGVVTLEAIYGNSGGNPRWCDWFFQTYAFDPAMGYTYYHCGQENPFGWRRMKKGLEYQFPYVARMARKGDIKLQLLSETAQDFLDRYPLTPAASLLSESGFTKPNDKSLWFNCRNYRMSLLWEGNRMFVRDIHLFDQNQECLYNKEVCTTPDAHFFTMPVVEGNVWSTDSVRSCLRFYIEGADGAPVEMRFGAPVQTNRNDNTALTLNIPVEGRDLELVVDIDENRADFRVKPLKKGEKAPLWFMALEHDPGAKLPFGKVQANSVDGRYRGYDYTFRVANATLADRRTAPRNSLGALTAFTITPDDSTISMIFGK